MKNAILTLILYLTGWNFSQPNIFSSSVKSQRTKKNTRVREKEK